MGVQILIKTSQVTATPPSLAPGELAYSELSDTLFIGLAVGTVYAVAGSGLFAKKASPTFTGTPTAPTATPGTNTTQLATTAFVAASAALYLPLAGGTVAGNLIVSGNLTVSGTTTTIDSTTLSVDDKNITLGDIASPTDVTADGGGITLKGTTDKTFNWVDSTDSWTSSEHVDLASGKVYKVAGTTVLTATTLGSGVVSSSLTSVGTVTTGTIDGGTF